MERIENFMRGKYMQLFLWGLLGVMIGLLIKWPDLQNIMAASTVREWVIPNFAAQSPFGFCALAMWSIPIIDEVSPVIAYGYNIFSGWFSYISGYWINGHSVFYVQLQSVPAITGSWYGPFNLFVIPYSTLAALGLFALAFLTIWTAFTMKMHDMIFPSLVIGAIGTLLIMGYGLFEIVNTLILAAMIYVALWARKTQKTNSTNIIMFVAAVIAIVLLTWFMFIQTNPVITAVDWTNWQYWAISW